MTAGYEDGLGGDGQRSASRRTAVDVPRDPFPTGDPDMDGDDESLETELILLALSAQDTGEPTQDMDLSKLTAAEKRALLGLWRERLEMERETDEADGPTEKP